jgi:hypothetical protein
MNSGFNKAANSAGVKPSCFVAGTLVMAVAGMVAIEKIKSGDKVISTDPGTMETGEKTVLETYIRQVDKLVHLTINGEEIVTTDNHSFYVQGRDFIEAGNLLVGDKLISVNGEDLFVKKHQVEELDELVDVYNFKVEDYHTYFVGDRAVWEHNKNCTSCMNEDGGSPDLDNVVSQRSDLNRAVKNTDNYRSMEREWSKALKSGKKVTDVDIKLTYENGSSRPSVFDVSYKIDDLKIIRHFTQ